MNKRADAGPLLIGLLVTWAAWVAMLLVLAILYRPNADREWVYVGLVTVHVLCACLVISVTSPVGTRVLVVAALLARSAALAYDIYGRSDLPFMQSGGDADGFYAAAVQVAADTSLAGETYGRAYTGIVGYLFHFVGPSPLVAQYCNVLFGTSAVILVVWMLTHLGTEMRATKTVTAIAALMPTAVIFSAVLLREAAVQFLVTAAVACFLRGFLSRAQRWMFAAAGLILCASAFHAGAIAVLLGFVLVSSLIDRHDGRLRFAGPDLKLIAPLVLVAGVILSQSPDLFLAKFSNVDTEAELFQDLNRRAGGSSYLTNLQIDSWFTFVLYAPLRAVYFLAAPVPWDWRSVMDAVAFTLDSCVYIWAGGTALLASRSKTPGSAPLRALLVIVVCSVLVFGAGVANTGTAMRHRTKLAMVILVMAGVAKSCTSTRGAKKTRERGLENRKGRS